MEIQNNGSPMSDGQQLRQIRVAYAMVVSGRTVEEILEEYGISEEEFSGWILDGTFAECAEAVTQKMVGVWAPYFLHSLLESARKGNVPAIKLYFDTFGRKNGVAVTASPEIETLRADLFGGSAE